MPLRWSFFPESEMSARPESEARALLVAAFPMYADFFLTTSFRGSIPEYRLFGRNEAGKLMTHIECGPRVALAANQQVRILGMQPCVSVHHETGGLETHHGPVMALPLLREMTHWPRSGVVDLQGMAW